MGRGVHHFESRLLATFTTLASLAAGCGSSATSDPPAAPPTSSSGASASPTSSDASQACVDAINADRASLGLAPYARWTSEESCEWSAQADSAANSAHSAFTKCGEMAQNECPGWPGPAGDMIDGCMKAMWAEGPGGGHYDNMSSTSYTKVACGFYTLADGSVWATQDFR